MGKLLNFITKASIYLTVFLVPLVWNPWTFEAVEFSKQYLLTFLVLLGILSWLAKMVLVERELHFKRTPLDLPIFLFALVVILSSIFSADLWSSLFGYYGRFSDGLLGVLAAVGFYFLTTNTVQRPRSLLKPFLLSATIIVFLGYLSFFGVLQQTLLAPFVQQVGFTPVAQSLEGFSIFIAFLISFLALLVLRTEIRQLPFAGNLALMFAAFGLLFLVNIPEVWILLLIGLLLVLLSGLFQRTLTGFPMRFRRLWLPAILLLLTVIFLFSPNRVPGLEQELPRESILSEEISWSIALQTVTENGKNLVLGSGPGTFALDFSKYKPAELNQTVQWQFRFDRSGSYISELLATTGILGLLSYLGLLLWFFLASLFFLKDKRNFLFVFGVMVLFAAQLVYYQTTVLQVLFWLFLALAVVSWEVPQKEFRFSLRRFVEFDVVAKALLLLFGFAVGATFFFGARFFAADMNYLASQSTARSNSEQQIEKAKNAVELNPWQAEYKIFLSRLYLARALSELQRPENVRNQEQISQDVQLAIAYTRGDSVGNQQIQGATELSPNRVASWEALGVVYRDITFAAGALEWSIRSFETAITLEPTNPVLYTELGKLEAGKGEFEKAREHFKKAVELKPDYAEPQLQLALLKEKEGETAAALSLIREVGLRYSLNAEGMFQLGRLLYNVGQAAEAISQFEQVLKTAPNHSNALFALGVAYESQGRIDEAILQFEKVFELNPDSQGVQQKLQELTQ